MSAGGPVPVLTLIDTVQVQGGAEKLAVDVTVRLDRSRFAPIFCITRWAPEWRDPLDEPGLAALEAADVPILGLKRHGKVHLTAWWPLVAELRRRRVAVLHSHKFGSNVWAAALGPLARVPAVVAHEHTWSFEGQAYRRWLDRHLVARGADVVVAVSRADRQRMIDVEGIPPERIRYIPNGVPAAGEGDGTRIRRELGIDPGAPVVGAVGSLRAQKAYEVLIDAAVLLRDRRPDARVVIAGGGPDLERLRGYAADAGVADRVSILGHRTDVPDVLRAFDVGVNCSDFEGQPLSILEQMDVGLPVVATRVGGVPDIIEDGVEGVLVPPRDPAAIAGAVTRLLDDPEAARAMGDRARRRRREEFDLDGTVARIEDLYDELLGARRATPSSAGPSASSSHSSLE